MRSRSWDGKKWKYTLASIIAKNFRCKHFYYGKHTVVFYGHKTDAEIASETFKNLFNAGNKLATNYSNNYRKEHGSANGIYNAYVLGFCDGIKEELEKQCTALMIVIPEDVENSYSAKTKDFRKMKHTIRRSGNESAYNNGVYNGRNAMSNSIAMS